MKRPRTDITFDDRSYNFLTEVGTIKNGHERPKRSDILQEILEAVEWNKEIKNLVYKELDIVEAAREYEEISKIKIPDSPQEEDDGEIVNKRYLDLPRRAKYLTKIIDKTHFEITEELRQKKYGRYDEKKKRGGQV